MLKPNMPSFLDTEGPAVPDGLPLVIDAHVHVFPNIPFAWDRELQTLDKMNIPTGVLEIITGQNAAEFFHIPRQYA